LQSVKIKRAARALGLALIESMAIASSRAEITLFEAARAHAAADERDAVIPADVRSVALMALRFRQSNSIRAFLKAQDAEDERMRAFLDRGTHREEE
jgi:magnesium chelatase subunit I